ncbi:hypothetical protein D3C72_1185480 [compost metagenome]
MPVDGDTAISHERAPPTESLYTTVAGEPLAVPLATAALCARAAGVAAITSPVALAAVKLVLHRLASAPKRPYAMVYMAERIGPLPRP